jgi:hypothetical protein
MKACPSCPAFWHSDAAASTQALAYIQLLHDAEKQAKRVAERSRIDPEHRLFCDSDNGADTAAVPFNVLAACERHKIDLFRPTHPLKADRVSRRQSILPPVFTER